MMSTLTSACRCIYHFLLSTLHREGDDHKQMQHLSDVIVRAQQFALGSMYLEGGYCPNTLSSWPAHSARELKQKLVLSAELWSHKQIALRPINAGVQASIRSRIWGLWHRECLALETMQASQQWRT